MHASKALLWASCSTTCRACAMLPSRSAATRLRRGTSSMQDPSRKLSQVRQYTRSDINVRGRHVSTSSRASPVSIERSHIASDVPVPRAIAAHLDEYVIGQDRAKRALAVCVFNHYIRAASNRNLQEEERNRELQLSRQRRPGEKSTEEESSILTDYVGQTRGTKRWTDDSAKRISPATRSSSTLSSDFFISLRPGEKKEAIQSSSIPSPRRAPEPVKILDNVSSPAKPRSKRSESPPPLMDKSNIILIGPSGSGKTHLIRTLSTSLSVPFIHVDATPLTSAGYVGEDVESIMSRLLEAANWSVEEAERGIVCIDEIDKLASPIISSPTGTIKTAGRDVGGTGVQQALLRLLEGSIVSVPDKRASGSHQGTTITKQNSMNRAGESKPWWSPEMQSLNAEQTKATPSAKATAVNTVQGHQAEMLAEGKQRGKLNSGADSTGTVRIDTSKILFVLSGAFVGLEDIVAARGGGKLEQAEPEDLTSYGLIPEFVGRLPVMVVLDELTEQDLCRILTEPKNALISQYHSLFAAYNIKLHFTKPAIASIAHQAAQSSKTASGARVLRRLLEKRLLDAMFDGPNGGAHYALMDKSAALGQSHVQLFSRGARSQWLNAIEEDEERSKSVALKKTKVTSTPASNEGATLSSKVVSQVNVQPRLKATSTSTSLLARIDEAALRRRARARLTRPSRVGNLRIAADR